MPSRVRGFSTADGSLLWSQDFHFEEGANEFAAWIEPAFSLDGRTAYVTTHFGGGAKPGSLYAVDVSLDGPEIFADGFESGDLSAWASTLD